MESPSSIGEVGLHGLNLDWKRFVTARTVDFMRHEIQALREAGADQPVTTNFMEDYTGLNYYKLAEDLDYVSWDSYPLWHYREDLQTAYDTGMQDDLMRSMKHKSFFLMESSPSSLNWQPFSKLKKPGILMTASLQTIAHGANSVQFFQIRQGRGGFEKFHGAVIDHYGGTLVMTYWSGIINETDLCYLGGTPHCLTDVLGLRSEEIDGLCDGETNCLLPVEKNSLQLNGSYTCEHLCDLVRLDGAKPLMTYGGDFYKGYPALTVHEYGSGRAYYVCTDAEQLFYDSLYRSLVVQRGIKPILEEIPDGFEISSRTGKNFEL